MRYLTDAADVTPRILSHAESIWEDWFADDESIEWDDFLDRMARYGEKESEPYGIPGGTNAAIRKIQRHVRAYRDNS